MQVKGLEVLLNEFHGIVLGELVNEEEFSKVLKLGRDTIPAMSYKFQMDNDYWNAQSKAWQEEYPELCKDGFFISTVEVTDLHGLNSGEVVVTYEKKTYEIKMSSYQAVAQGLATVEELVAATKEVG